MTKIAKKLEIIDLQAKARVLPDGENARVLFQQLVFMRKRTVPHSSL